MKKNFFAIMVASLFAILWSSVAWAQTDAASAAADEESSVQEGEGDLRPEMPKLFYTGEQRRILEAVRQDVIAEENFEEEDFVPLVLRQEQVELGEDAVVNRQGAIRVDSFILNRSTGKGIWWSKGREIEFWDSGQNGSFNRDNGIAQFRPSEEEKGTIEGVDTFNNTRFILKVGQQLAPDGEVSETYPVVIKK